MSTLEEIALEYNAKILSLENHYEGVLYKIIDVRHYFDNAVLRGKDFINTKTKRIICGWNYQVKSYLSFKEQGIIIANYSFVCLSQTVNNTMTTRAYKDDADRVFKVWEQSNKVKQIKESNSFKLSDNFNW